MTREDYDDLVAMLVEAAADLDLDLAVGPGGPGDGAGGAMNAAIRKTTPSRATSPCYCGRWKGTSCTTCAWWTGLFRRLDANRAALRRAKGGR